MGLSLFTIEILRDSMGNVKVAITGVRLLLLNCNLKSHLNMDGNFGTCQVLFVSPVNHEPINIRYRELNSFVTRLFHSEYAELVQIFV